MQAGRYPGNQMKDVEICKAVRTVLRNQPFVVTHETTHGYYTEAVAAKLRFSNRDGKFYVKVDLQTNPSDHERERKRFYDYLFERCAQFGWVPHLTSGGCGKYTFRLNGDQHG